MNFHVTNKNSERPGNVEKESSNKQLASKKNFHWYLKRLSKMTFSEICFRLGRAVDELWLRFRVSLAKEPLFLKDWNPDSFSFCSCKKSGLSSFLLKINPIWDPEKILMGWGPAYSFEWQWFSNNDCWHRSPDTNKQWPKKFYAKIPHDPLNPYGDVRVIWEPNRLQHLVMLAILYTTQKKRDREVASRAAKMALMQIKSWFAANPPLIGVNYISVMECALRILSISHTMDLLRDYTDVDANSWKMVLKLIYSHARIIERRLSLYSSTGNHTIAECVGLLYAALLFPELPEANKWRARSLSLLEEQAERQILPDGGGVEQATWYLRFIVDLYGCAINVLKFRGHKVPQRLSDAWHRGTSYLTHLQYDSGNVADIGDRDDGWALVAYGNSVGLFAQNQKNQKSENGISTFMDSGYTVYSSNGWKLIFDHGPFGMPPSFGHAHADCLSVQLFFKSSPVLIDPGTYCYNCSGKWRSYFRSTPAHNTVTIADEDQALQQSPFMWSSGFNGQILKREITSKIVLILATHDGYRQLHGAVAHLRGIAIMKQSDRILIWDLIEGDTNYKAKLHWHIGPEWTPSPCGKGLLLSSKKDKLFIKILGGKIKIKKGQDDPPLGWYSDIYGNKVPLNTIEVKGGPFLPHEFITCIDAREMGSKSDLRDREILDKFRAWAKDVK